MAKGCSFKLPRRYDSLPFLYGYGLAGGNVREFLDLSAWPFDPHRLDFAGGTEAKGKDQFALREVAGAAAQHLPLALAAVLDAHHGSDAVAVGGRSPQFHAERMISVAAIVAKEICRTSVGSDQEVEVAIIIYIG